MHAQTEIVFIFSILLLYYTLCVRGCWTLKHISYNMFQHYTCLIHTFQFIKFLCFDLWNILYISRKFMDWWTAAFLSFILAMVIFWICCASGCVISWIYNFFLFYLFHKEILFFYSLFLFFSFFFFIFYTLKKQDWK